MDVAKEKLEEILAKLRRGANFATLASQHSLDRSAAAGGAYPPLPVDTGSPLLQRVAEMKEGVVQGVEEVEVEGRTQYRIVQLFRRKEARSESYAERRDEIEAGLAQRTIAQLELDAWMRIMYERYDVETFGLGKAAEWRADD